MPELSRHRAPRLPRRGRFEYSRRLAPPGREARPMHAVRVVMGTLVAAVVVGLPWGYASYRQSHYRNFHEVTPGVLYRSGQLSQPGLDRVLHDHGIRTVVTLRDPEVSLKEPDWGEE